MRLKLVMGVSSVAALIGAGTCIGIVLAAFSSLKPFTAPSLLATSTLVIPAVVITLASVFVYRHTARRRKLQAILTALIATVLTLCIFFIASILSSRRTPAVPNQPAGPHIAS